MIGNTIIIIITFVILFQVVQLALEQKKRHREIIERLERLEAKPE